MGRLFYSADELLKRPLFPGMHDPTHLYYHFRPARPADLVVSRDPLSGELNVAAGTYGLLTEKPYTICLHSSKHSYDTTRNLQMGSECVIALPDRDQVAETWWTALPIPRGINEADICGFSPLPSKLISVPGIAECPVNLECKVEWIKDWYTHYAIFLRVLAASLDEKYLEKSRLEIIRQYPTYEVDDQTNRFGGAIERLGVNGKLFDCPAFPVGAKKGEGTWQGWLSDLTQAGFLSTRQQQIVEKWIAELEHQTLENSYNSPSDSLSRKISRVFELAGWEEWNELRTFLAREE